MHHTAARFRYNPATAAPPAAHVASAGGGTTSTTATHISVTVPATAAVGQVGIMMLNIGANVTFSSGPSGWTNRVVITHNSVNNIGVGVWTKTLVSGDIGASGTWTCSGVSEMLGLMDVFSGVTEANFTYSAVNSGTTAAANPTVSVASGGLIHSNWIGFINSATTFTATQPSGYTQGVARATSSSTNNHAAVTGYQAGSGTLGGDNATFSNTVARTMAVSVAVNP